MQDLQPGERPPRQSLENPFYYLENFQQVLDWVGVRHGDLLDEAERAFLDRFPRLPRASRALLVRMAMRKGRLFRAGKLRYAEIGCPLEAAAPLIAEGWVEAAPALRLDELFGLLTKGEIAQAFGLPAKLRKDELRAALAEGLGEGEGLPPRPLAEWCPALPERVLGLAIDELCERLRLMFFGNLRQDWSEFVLADLGIYRYEQVPFSAESRAFHSRRELDDYLHLQRCRERFEAGAAPDAVLAEIPAEPYANSWLERRRGKLLFRLAQQHERDGNWPEALRLHAGNRYPEARQRCIRMLERCAQVEAALELALAAEAAPESEAEAQQLERLLPRLRRALGRSPVPRRAARRVERLDLRLPQPAAGVEWAVREHLDRPEAPVHYVENTLLNSLFGLLCWEAVFAPLPGAFFHPFHSGPADLTRPDFAERRREPFERCLARLDDGSHREAILRTFAEKHGLQSPFVAWGLLDEPLLRQALACIPARHLRLVFERLLRDVKANRSGLPDLIQFWPEEARYRMIEVKGPGDRLQDNQCRWLDYALEHGIPVAVCYVQWAEESR